MYSRILYDRICQKALRGGGEWNPPKILLGGLFYWLVEFWGEVYLTIRTFFKAKNTILQILNID